MPRADVPPLEQQLRSLRRVALAVACPGGPTLHADLVRELAEALEVAMVCLAVFEDDARTTLRTLAARLDGRPLAPSCCTLQGSPLTGAEFRYVPAGAAAEFGAGTLFAAEGMEGCAAHRLAGGAGDALGVLVAMDRRPIAGGNAEHTEAMLKIVAGRLAAEIERGRIDDVLRTTALAVSSARSGSVFDELVRLLATTLRVEEAFIARHEPSEPAHLHMLARCRDGEIAHGIRFAMAGTPCDAVLGQRFRAVALGLQQRFPFDEEARAQGFESFAGFPLMALDGRSLGILGVASRRPLGQLERVEAMLKIVAVRAAAELERLSANEALARSEASYRAIFEAAEDAIFIHDWDSGEIVDVNTRACETFGWSREEFVHLPLDEISAGTPPYTGADALRRIRLAKLDRCPPLEWLSRNKDGSLHWDEVRLKPATLDGRPHVLAFARDITERKSALAALQAQEEKYRAIFDGSVDPMVLWNEALQVVDVNDAFVETTGLTRAQIIGRHWTERPDAADIERLLPFIQGALAGQEQRAIESVSRADGSLFDIELRYLPVRLAQAHYALGVGRDVTAQLEHERELARSAARLRATVEAAFDGVIGMDGDGRIVEFNAAAERVFGHRREDVLGRLLSDVLLPERHRAAHTQALENFRRHRRGGRMIGRLVETTALHADGNEIPVEMAISVATVPEGNIFVGHLRDITERRRADRALRDSEAQYRAIFNASADALVLRAANFAIVDVNATYEAMSGYSRAEVLGVARVLANPPEVVPTILALHERALAGAAVSLDTQLVRRDGQRYDLELRGVPIQHRGQPHVLYIGRDITQGKRAERALRDSEEQYRAIFNASADALVLRHASFRAVEVNPAYATMSGYTREEVMAADRVLTQADAAVRDRHRREHDLALAGKQLRFEVTATRKDGSTLQAEVRGTPMMYRGEPHVLYAVRDITERKAAEQRRAELERQLRQAQKMEAIGQLTGGIAHDFNNILASVIGYLVLAQERAETLSDATLVRQLGQAHLAADRARELIAQMLAFARRQRGERRVVRLPPLLHQTLSLLRATLPSTVSLEVDVPPGDGLEGSDAPCVDADPVQLEQVLFNLCINARDAIGGQGRIAVRLRPALSGPGWLCASCRAGISGGRWVELAVEDDGPGIAADVAERIFDPFFSTKAPGQGTGMGLAMVHGIVHDHGGHLRLSTAPGGGARFGIWLPRADAAEAAGTSAPVTAPASAALCGQVMLVEDDPMVGDYLSERLASWGLQVQLQRDAPAAATWLSDPSNATDLLITDQTMPLLTGLRLAERVHAVRPKLPIVLISGNASAFDADELARCGISAALPKPIDAERLRALLRRLLADAAAPHDGR